ncbi:hypothetical protein [Salinicoccus sp. HZC-1]|uniref:hypothetical protein n=1 Tax=Salinicoccus sp. HZC-1 TaxID=3385497 RepID=UPI00398A54ED
MTVEKNLSEASLNTENDRPAKRDIKTPSEYMTNQAYFDKKAEVDERIEKLQTAHEKAVSDQREAQQKYNKILVTGTDDEIQEHYGTLGQAKKDAEITLQRYKAAADGREQVLDEYALTIAASKQHADALLADEEQEARQELIDAKLAHTKAVKKAKQFNQKYESYRYGCENVLNDIGYHHRKREIGMKFNIDRETKKMLSVPVGRGAKITL